MVTANQKCIIDIYARNKMEFKQNTKTVIKSQGGKRPTKTKTINKMAIKTYISIVTLNVSG